MLPRLAFLSIFRACSVSIWSEVCNRSIIFMAFSVRNGARKRVFIAPWI